MYVAKKSFHSHEFTYKNEILIAMLSKYQGHGYFLTVTKTRQQHSFCGEEEDDRTQYRNNDG